jgi:hypothetical protein
MNIKKNGDSILFMFPEPREIALKIVSVSPILKKHLNSIQMRENDTIKIKFDDVQSMHFVLDYLELQYKYLEGKREIKIGKEKLKNIHLSYILPMEYDFIRTAYNKSLSFNANLPKIDKLMEAAKYFQLEQLKNKLCCLVVHHIRMLSI